MARNVRAGTVSAQLRLDGQQFALGMRRATRETTAFQGALGRVRGAVTRLGPALAGLAGTAALAGIVSHLRRATTASAEWGARLVEQASVTGLSASRLDLLRRAFEANGASVATVDSGLARFNRRLEFARQGLGEYARAYEDLDLDPSTFATTEDALRAVIQRLSEMPNAARRGGVAFRLFGTAAQELDLTLSQGLVALDAEIERQRGLAEITDENAQKLKDLNQALTDFRNRLTLRQAETVAKNAEALEGLANKMGDLIALLGEFAGPANAYINYWLRITTVHRAALRWLLQLDDAQSRVIEDADAAGRAVQATFRAPGTAGISAEALARYERFIELRSRPLPTPPPPVQTDAERAEALAGRIRLLRRRDNFEARRDARRAEADEQASLERRSARWLNFYRRRARRRREAEAQEALDEQARRAAERSQRLAEQTQRAWDRVGTEASNALEGVLGRSNALLENMLQLVIRVLAHLRGGGTLRSFFGFGDALAGVAGGLAGGAARTAGGATTGGLTVHGDLIVQGAGSDTEQVWASLSNFARQDRRDDLRNTMVG